MRKKKKWTVLVISNKNEKRIRQLNIPKASALFAIIFLLSLAGSLIITQIRLQHFSEENATLTEHINQTQAELQQANQEIVYYQEETAWLDDQVLQLTDLQQELKGMINSMDPEYINEANLDLATGGVEYNSLQVNEQVPVEKEETLPEQYARLKENVPTLLNNYKKSIENFQQINAELSRTPILWPTDATRITSTFGNRSDPFTTSDAYHSGMDIAGPYGTPVYATADGQVSFAARNGGYGNSIVINHTSILQTRYAHLAQIEVEEGQQVKKGDTIGYMGSTGRSTGVHLHYEVIKNGVTIDPYPYMTFMQRLNQSDTKENGNENEE
ncbi:M23 family metallopeptidase [Radiobacillus sp. PE A8.2]|uniref:M23 family metallopeptidase n=1 Tax=Radiobacillus sp. PE A8.2 TaxID=3380349 RepID=UPI0038906131